MKLPELITMKLPQLISELQSQRELLQAQAELVSVVLERLESLEETPDDETLVAIAGDLQSLLAGSLRLLGVDVGNQRVH